MNLSQIGIENVAKFNLELNVLTTLGSNNCAKPFVLYINPIFSIFKPRDYARTLSCEKCRTTH